MRAMAGTAEADALRILFLPSVQEDATSDRSPALLRMLRRRHEVVGLPFPWDPYLYDPRRSKPARYLLYVLDKLLAGIRGVRVARDRGVDLAFCETPHHALVGLGIARLLGLPCVWDSHGNALLFARSVGKGPLYTFLSSRLDRFLGRRVDLLITVTERDAAAYEAMGVPRSRIRVVPTSVDVDQVDLRAGLGEPVPPWDGRKTLLFFGSFAYEPNRRALEFINRRLAPFLERERIPCEIRIAGRDVPRTAMHPTVRRLGFVENLHAWIRASDLCIVPVWTGVGILTKVVDIMATGTPAVLSGFATAGIPEIRYGVHALVASTEDAFCAAVAHALRHPAEMRVMARNARGLVEARYDWRVQEPRLEEMLETLRTQPRGTVRG